MRITIKAIVLTLALTFMLSLATAENKGLQFLQSLAVPGLSQIRSGHDYGYAMLSSEAAIISGMLFLSTERKLKEQEYYEYALKYAHLNTGDYSDQFYRNMSRYNSSGYEAGGYNAEVREQAMQLYPDDPIQQQVYIDANIYPEGYAWAWDSTENRSAYSKIRIESQNLRDYGKIAVGVLIVNHLISGIDVLRMISQSNRSQVYLDIKDSHPMLMLNVEW